MIETPARVLSVEPGYAWVSSERRSGCSQCATSDSCGVSSLGKLFGARPLRMRLADPLGVRPGDEVIIGLSEQRLLGAAAVAYLLPVTVMIAIALFGAQLGYSQGAVMLASFAGLGAGLWLVKCRAAREDVADRYRPVLLRQQDSGECRIEFEPVMRGVNHE